MRGKLSLVAGLAAGYVLGTRAGRGRYEQISKAAGKFWQSNQVQRQVHQVEDFAKDKAPDVLGFVTGNVKKVVGKGSTKKASHGSNGTSSNSTSSNSTNDDASSNTPTSSI